MKCADKDNKVNPGCRDSSVTHTHTAQESQFERLRRAKNVLNGRFDLCILFHVCARWSEKLGERLVIITNS